MSAPWKLSDSSDADSDFSVFVDDGLYTVSFQNWLGITFEGAYDLMRFLRALEKSQNVRVPDKVSGDIGIRAQREWHEKMAARKEEEEEEADKDSLACWQRKMHDGMWAKTGEAVYYPTSGQGGEAIRQVRAGARKAGSERRLALAKEGMYE